MMGPIRPFGGGRQPKWPCVLFEERKLSIWAMKNYLSNSVDHVVLLFVDLEKQLVHSVLEKKKKKIIGSLAEEATTSVPFRSGVPNLF